MRVIAFSFAFYLLLLNNLNAQSAKADGYSSHRQGVFLYDVDGLVLSKIQNIAKLSNSYKQNDLISCDTIGWDSVRYTYSKLEFQNFDGVIKVSLNVPFVVNSNLLETVEKKRTVLERVNEADIVDIYFKRRNKAGKTIRGLIKGYSGFIFFETNK